MSPTPENSYQLLVAEVKESVTVMFVTLWWWQISEVGGRIIMLATFFVILEIFSMY